MLRRYLPLGEGSRLSIKKGLLRSNPAGWREHGFSFRTGDAWSDSSLRPLRKDQFYLQKKTQITEKWAKYTNVLAVYTLGIEALKKNASRDT